VTPSLEPIARQDIADVLIRYATGIDRRDWDLFRTCFTVDCLVDYGDIGLWHGVDEVTEWMDRTHREAGHTLHRVTNLAVEATADGAHSRAYVDAIVMAPDNERGVRAVGFYDDVLIDTGDGWQIARRRFTPVFYEGLGGTS
jgi:3-phenylpropionate/cinnamic acid dioxygenase small subunit